MKNGTNLDIKRLLLGRQPHLWEMTLEESYIYDLEEEKKYNDQKNLF